MSLDAGAKKRVVVATLTASDTRTADDDAGGALLRELLVAAGFEVGPHAIVREDLEMLRASVVSAAAFAGVDAVVVTGGTGLAPRDVTIEAVLPLFDKTIDGFGEAFRRLSFDEIGPRGILSRAIAGTTNGRVVVAIPGSPAAVRLAVNALLGPTLEHAVGLASGRSTKHHHPHSEKKASC